MAATRADLHKIARMCDALPEEVEHRGVDGEAMMLLAPATDPEAWGHHEASLRAGRLCRCPLNECPGGKACPTFKAWVEDVRDESHPLWVLGTWEMIWVDALEHDRDEPLTIANAVGYLDQQLTYMGGFPHVPFEDFARDLRRCVAHFEAVLHDGEQVDRGAPCMTCNVPLLRTWGKDDKADGWACPRCRQTSTEAQYRYAVMNLHREEATHLTDRDMEIRTGVKAGTVRVWAQRGEVDRRRDQGRTVYAVADVVKRMTA